MDLLRDAAEVDVRLPRGFETKLTVPSAAGTVPLGICLVLAGGSPLPPLLGAGVGAEPPVGRRRDHAIDAGIGHLPEDGQRVAAEDLIHEIVRPREVPVVMLDHAPPGCPPLSVVPFPPVQRSAK